MKQSRKLSVILNPSSGAAPRELGARVDEKICEAFRDHGIECTLLPLGKLSPVDALRTIQQQGEDAALVAGGDGTVSSIVNTLLHTKMNLRVGVLPVGTLNHFAKDAGVPLELDHAVHAIVRDLELGMFREVDVAEVNGCYFINNSSIGVYPMAVLDREARERTGQNRWSALIQSMLNALRPSTLRLLDAVTSCSRRVVRSPLVFVGNNRYVLRGSEIGSRARLDEGVLTLAIARSSTKLRLLSTALLSVVGIDPGKDRLAVEHTNGILLALDDPDVHVSVDGEVRLMKPPLKYRAVPRAIKLVGGTTKQT